MDLAADVQTDWANSHMICRPVVDTVVRPVASAEVAVGMHMVAAEGSHVQVIPSVSMVRMEGNHGECTETALASSCRSGDRTEGGCTFPNPCLARSCEIVGFHDLTSACEFGRR